MLPFVVDAVSTPMFPVVETSDNKALTPVAVALVRLTAELWTSTEDPETVAVPPVSAETVSRNACPLVAVMATLRPAPLAVTFARAPAARPVTPVAAVIAALPPFAVAVPINTLPRVEVRLRLPPVAVAEVRLTLAASTSTDTPVTIAERVMSAKTLLRNA